MTTPENCAGCGEPMRTSPAELAPGDVRHFARGRCKPCYNHLRLSDGFSRVTRRGADLLEDFRFIAETEGERAPNVTGWTRGTRRDISERLGVTVDALDRALYRDVADRAA